MTLPTPAVPEGMLVKQTEENEIDLRVYWNIFNKYKWRILALTLLIGLLASLFAFSLPLIYRATSTLLIESEKGKIVSIEEVYGLDSLNKDFYQTQVQILQSRKLAEKVVDKLNLVSHKVFDPNFQKQTFKLSIDLNRWLPSAKPPKPPSPEERHEGIIGAVMKSISVTPVRNSQLVQIGFESLDAGLAALVPNTLANVFIENDLEEKLKMTQKAASWLTEKVTDLRKNLENSEKVLHDYLESQNLIDVSGIKGVATQQIGELTKNLITSKQRLAEVENAYKQVQALSGKPVEAFESIPAVLNNPMIQQLKGVELEAERKLSELSRSLVEVQNLHGRALEIGTSAGNHSSIQRWRSAEAAAANKVQELSQRYGPKHPEMIAAQVELEKARAETAKYTAQSQKISNQPAKAYSNIPVVLNNPMIQSLVQAELQAESKVSELSQRYGDKHPTMVAAISELESARTNTAQQMRRVMESAQSELRAAKVNTAKQIQQVISGITKEYEIARANVMALEQSSNQKEQEIQGLGRKEYQLGVLQREVEVNKQLYDLFLTRFRETDAAKDLQPIQSLIGRIVDAAQVPTVPYKPNKKLVVTIALVLGFMFALMLAFLLEYLDDTLKNGNDVEQKLGLHLLGILPKLKTRKKDKLKPRLMFLEEEKSHFAESVRTIRTSVLLSGLDNPNKIFLVTSSSASEGKTTVSLNQAFALGQLEKTLLIDADMRRPSIASTFGFTDKVPGLSEMVAGTREFAECIHHIDGAEIDLIPSGAIPPDPLELLASQRFKDIMAQLAKQYRFIVIDSAPTHVVSDALVLANYATAIIYVIKADETPYRIIQNDLKRLRQAAAPLTGVVLNQMDMQKSSGYYGKYDYYGNRYGYYYGKKT